MHNIDEIVEFVKDKTGSDKVEASSDIFADLGCCGDDFHELIEEFEKKYQVDMTSYLWYFHTDEEGSWNSLGGSFFKTPNERVNRIPITPALLFESAQTGKWNIDYPAHVLPKKRYDIIINQIAVVMLIAFVIYSCLK